jgi:hypothetical protein
VLHGLTASTPFLMSWRVKLDDGRYQALRIRVNPQYTDQGHVSRYVIVITRDAVLHRDARSAAVSTRPARFPSPHETVIAAPCDGDSSCIPVRASV